MPLVKNTHDIEVRNASDSAAVSKSARHGLHYGAPGHKPKKLAGKYKLENVQLIGDRTEPVAIHKKECQWCNHKKCYGKCEKDLI